MRNIVKFLLALLLIWAGVAQAESLTYTVREGDSLSRIAKRLNPTKKLDTKEIDLVVDAIVKANPAIKNPNAIYPGQVFVINFDAVRAPTMATQKAAPAKNVAAVKIAPVATLKKAATTATHTKQITYKSVDTGIRVTVVPIQEAMISVDQPSETEAVHAAVQRTTAQTEPDPLFTRTDEQLTGVFIARNLVRDNTEQRTTIRKFLVTHLGAPYNVAHIENVLMEKMYPAKFVIP